MEDKYIRKQYYFTKTEAEALEKSLDSVTKNVGSTVFHPIVYQWKAVTIKIGQVLACPPFQCTIQIHNKYKRDLEDFLNLKEFKFLKEKNEK